MASEGVGRGRGFIDPICVQGDLGILNSVFINAIFIPVSLLEDKTMMRPVTYMHSLHILMYSGPSPVSGSSMVKCRKKCQISRALFFGQGPRESVGSLL